MDYRTLIREKRKEKGLSQERLAKLVQVSQPFIAEIESGRKKPSVDVRCWIFPCLATGNHKVAFLVQRGYNGRYQNQRQGSGDRMADILYIVVPCYNEEEVLPETSRRLRAKLEGLMAAGKISERSRVLFVNDGSRDRTWELITRLHGGCPLFCGADLSRNRGHQNGGADDGEGAVRHGHLHGRRPPGRH